MFFCLATRLSGLYGDYKRKLHLNFDDFALKNMLTNSKNSDLEYAGDVSPVEAFAWWQAGEAVLVDIRSDAEREWVGFVPGAVALAWKQWPGMVINAGFDEDLKAAVPVGKKAVLLCRSGVRSIAAAKRATELGIQAYNILEGFEGDPDGQAQRGHKGGWRLRGLPWRQG